MSAPTRRKPSRRSVVRVSEERRNASIGSGASAALSSPAARIGCGAAEKRASAQAAPAVAAAARPHRQAELREPRFEIGDQLRLAAKEMRGAGDVEKQSVGAAPLVEGRDRGRVARRPQREPSQRRVVGGRIGGAHLQALGFCARVRERLADADAVLLGGRVRGSDARRAGDVGGEDEGARRINRLAGAMRARLRGETAQDRPARQPD